MTRDERDGTAECPGLVQTNASAVQWCTIPVGGATNRYKLYRENDPNNTCDGSASDVHGRLPDAARTSGASPTCVTGQYPTVVR